MNREKIISGLNDLLAKNYDAERGYNNAAQKSDNPVLKSFYRSKASNRYSYGHQIKDILTYMDAEIDKGTSLAGDLHNAWINFRNIFSINTEEAILDEVERGEEASLHEYDEFLKNRDLPERVRQVITYQRNNIARALNKVDMFEEQMS